MTKLFSYSIESNGTFTRIEGAFLGISGTNLVFASDDPSSPWVVNPTEAYTTEAERDAAISRGEKLLASLSPVKKAQPTAQPKASKKAQPVAVKVTTKAKAKKKTA